MTSLGKFNYALRPAKTIERKMLCEAFARLTRIAPLSQYRYIGFGSTEFCDFRLFHERLGINQMISIEGEIDCKFRVEFNRPHSCVEVKWGISHEVLPTLDWPDRVIVWLDYDSPLDKKKLEDIALIAGAAKTGSLLLVTVPVNPGGSDDANIVKKRLQVLKDRVGNNKVPSTIGGKDLAKWGLANACRNIINNEISQVLNSKNGPLAVSQRVCYKQLFNFHYADGTKMLSVGGVLLNEEDNKSLSPEECFKDLGFISFDDTPYAIEPPILTWREMRHLDTLLPGAGKLPDWLPEDHRERYRRVYRYFPNFTEVEA